MMVKLYDIKFLFDIDAYMIYICWLEMTSMVCHGFDGLSKNVVCPYWQF